MATTKGYVDAAVAAVAGAPTDAEYIVGAASSGLSNEKVKAQLADNLDPDDYPGSPNTMDDEFEGGGSLDAKWTIVNDPLSGDAANQTDYAGFLHIGLLELGTDNFANAIQIYQTAPAATAVATYVAKVAIASVNDGVTVTDACEFAGVGIAIINSTNSEAIGMGIQFNDGVSLDTDVNSCQAFGFNELFSSFSGSNRIVPESAWIYLRLRKTTTAAYTSANTYVCDYSLNGIIWHNYGATSKTFTTAADRVGLLFRRPKSATGTPKAEVVVDYFRRTA